MIEDGLVKLERFNPIYLGFSGGLDSTVLLHCIAAIPALKKKLVVIHVNHGLSPNATYWSLHCQKLCENLNLPLIIKELKLSLAANIEEEARKARYQVFRSLLLEGACLALAHHQQDQAETLVLQLVRGTGIDGLAAIKSETNCGKGVLIRPFLNHSKDAIKAYADLHHLSWIEDESNQDSRFSRNFLRQEVFPILQARWPKLAINFSRTAVHCQQAQRLLYDLALIDCPSLAREDNTIALMDLLALSKDRLANVIRTWLKINKLRLPSTKHLQCIMDELIFAKADAKPLVSFGKYSIRRQAGLLYFLKAEKNQTFYPTKEWANFPDLLEIPGVAKNIFATSAPKGIKIPPNSKISLRFRQGGEVMRYRQQTKSLKKLFQEWKIPAWERGQIPLVYINDELVMIPGYAIHDGYYSGLAGPDVYQIALIRDFF